MLHTGIKGIKIIDSYVNYLAKYISCKKRNIRFLNWSYW